MWVDSSQRSRALLSRSATSTPEGAAAALTVSEGTAWTGVSSIGKKGSCRVWVDSSTHDWTPSYRLCLKTPSLTIFLSEAALS